VCVCVCVAKGGGGKDRLLCFSQTAISVSHDLTPKLYSFKLFQKTEAKQVRKLQFVCWEINLPQLNDDNYKGKHSLTQRKDFVTYSAAIMTGVS
jgi:hypothetical protein